VILAPFHTTLKDGTAVLIREVTPEDAELLKLGFDHLSPRSRRFRFFGAISALSDAQIEAFTSPSDRDHLAIGAAATDDEVLDPAGIVRCVRLPNDPRCAEFAVTVVDRYQRRGLGTLLMGCLARVARHNGIDRLEGHVTRNNHRMLTLLHDLGARREIGPDAWVHRVVLDLKDDPADYPDTAAGEAFRRAYALTRVMPPLTPGQGARPVRGRAAPAHPHRRVQGNVARVRGVRRSPEPCAVR
jgi:GNAT superfamily N-acetyltransferase